MSELSTDADLREAVDKLRRRLMKTPSDLHLPYDRWRVGQRPTLRAARFSKKRHRMIQAPTGSGKSLIAAALGKVRPSDRTVTLTATNALLSQYANTYNHLSLIKGARNYPCIAAKDELQRYFRLVSRKSDIMCDDGPCRAGVKCSLRESGCGYYDAVRAASASATPITNYAYWLAMRRYAGGLGKADTVICDEAHALPEELMKAHQIRVSRHELRGERPPKSITGWRSFAARMVSRLKRDSAEDEDQRVRKISAIERFDQLSNIDSTWAFDATHDGYTFEPTIPRLLMPLLADDSSAVVYLSATITPQTLHLLDISPDDIDVITLPSTFDVERRPIYLVKTVRVDYKMSGLEREYWLDRHDTIIARRLDRKGIVLCGSYDRQEALLKSSKYSGIMYAPASRDLTAAVEKFREAVAPAILVSPAIEQGFDFPYDQCEYQIISKMPFPDTRSNIMRARIAKTPEYRNHLTMQRLVQSVGRGMRADDDTCETFILDDHARWFIHKFDELAPQSFLDAVRYCDVVPRPLPKLKVS